MGTDIHLIIEAQDDKNTWHCAWHSGLSYSTWFVSNFEDPKNMYTSNKTGLRNIRDRDYLLFGLLSELRYDNTLESYGITGEEGVARPGWPKDITSVAIPEIEDTDLHSHSHLTLADILDLKNRISALDIDQKKDENAFHTKENFLSWAEQIEQAVENLLGDTPILKHAIGSLPSEEEYNNPDFMPWVDVSGHKTMENHNRFERMPKPTPDKIRILISYDN